MARAAWFSRCCSSTQEGSPVASPVTSRASVLGRCAAALVAVVLSLSIGVLTPTTAHAAARFGPAASASLQESWGPTGTGSWADCSLSAYWMLDGSVMSVKGSIQCVTGFSVASLTIPNLTFSGPGCTVPGGIGSELDGIESPTSFFAGPATTSNCVVDQVCADFAYRTHGSMPWSDDASASACSPISVGGPVPPSTDASCSTLTYRKPVPIGAPIRRVSGVTHWGAQEWRFEVVNTGSQPVAVGIYGYSHSLNPNTDSSHGYWRMEAGATTGTTDTYGPESVMPKVITVPAGGSFTQNLWLQTHERELVDRAWNAKPGYILGVGYVAGVPMSANYWYDTPGNRLQGVAGLTRSVGEGCLAYWGEKIELNPPTPGEETPLAALDAPPPQAGSETEPPSTPTAPVADDSCDFSFTDPSSWAGAGICQLVGMFKALIDAVAGIPGAILDGLAALFVPSDGFLDAEVTSLRDDLESSQPGAYVTAVTDQTVNLPSAGCGGIPVDWTISGKSFDFDLLPACSGSMASVASIVKLVASAFLVVFGALACLRAIGSGFGWSPSIGKSAGAS